MRSLWIALLAATAACAAPPPPSHPRPDAGPAPEPGVEVEDFAVVRSTPAHELATANEAPSEPKAAKGAVPVDDDGSAAPAPKAASAKDPTDEPCEGQLCHRRGVVAMDDGRFEEGTTLFRIACAHGFAASCRELGYAYSFGRGVTQDRARSEQLYERACKAGDGMGCFNRGVQLLEGAPFPDDEKLASTFFDRGCILDYGEACNNLGDMVNKREINGGRGRAKALFEKACRLGSDLGCKNLDRLR